MLAFSAFFVLLLGSVSETHSLSLHERDGIIPCESISAPEVSGAEVISISAEEKLNASSISLVGTSIETIYGLDICQVNVSLTHPEVGDKVTIEVWLPLKHWNHRFQAAGGGGWMAGYPATWTLGDPVRKGYVAASTDGGALAPDGVLGPKTFSSPGVIDVGLFTDFASRALHEMAVVSKAVAGEYYGSPVKYSYWNGCSTGGRQGYMMAQKYPDDFDGIMANAPALYWPTFMLSLNWAHFLMNSEKTYPDPCVYAAFQKASIKACDGLDGVIDGIIADPRSCLFEPHSLIGLEVECNGKQMIVSSKDADIIARIRQGPRSPTGLQLWDGYDYGIDYQGIAPTITRDGATGNVPETMADNWVQYFLKKDPNFDFSTIVTLEQLTELFAIAHSEWGGIIGTDNPDLSAFRDKGGKLLSWHGTADNRIMINNTIRYRTQVEGIMGGSSLVNDFYRLFFPPGVSHCGGGYGPTPYNAFDALVAWVEQGKKPETILGAFMDEQGHNVTREICPWPLVSRYNGVGDPKRAKSYSCANSYGPPATL
ncbi:Tannase/feruloyl esterase [Aspergillus pseudodeflectus]|uniref:Carboxylic ester hydrolase n=1 Tax=Aspergillus pseudodeflectus TaxID=176178 RepID=A0ABR4KIZ0_9EURO